VKTLHPRIHGAILADLDKPEHRAALESTTSPLRPGRVQPVPLHLETFDRTD